MPQHVNNKGRSCLGGPRKELTVFSSFYDKVKKSKNTPSELISSFLITYLREIFENSDRILGILHSVY